MNHPSHGFYFVIVYFSELFGNESYIDHHKTLNELYMSNKIGYGTKAYSIIGTYFQKIFHAPYRKVSTGSSNIDVKAQVELPDLTTFEKWDVRDGISGRKYCIKDETRKTEAQLENWIWNQLTGSPQLLVCDLLHDSHTMSNDLFTLIITFYEGTMHSGKFDPIKLGNSLVNLSDKYSLKIDTLGLVPGMSSTLMPLVQVYMVFYLLLFMPILSQANSCVFSSKIIQVFPWRW